MSARESSGCGGPGAGAAEKIIGQAAVWIAAVQTDWQGSLLVAVHMERRGKLHAATVHNPWSDGRGLAPPACWRNWLEP